MKSDDMNLRAQIVADIKECLDTFNPFVKSYRMVKEHLAGQEIPTMKLRILGKRNCDGRQYNLPTASEVAALIVGDFDPAGFDRDVIVHTHSGLLQRIPILSAAYLPLQYPLLFPFGEDGFYEGIEFRPHNTARTIKRHRVTIRDWLAYRIQHRQNDQGSLLFGCRLFQQFVVDGYTMIESGRLRWIRDNQKDLRAEMYKGLQESILRGETNTSTTGRRIVLPSTFIGGPRYMFQNYQDAMTICGWAGYPDLFVTFTCNHKWPELTRYFTKFNFKSEDRADMICRIFKIKLDRLVKDIKKGNIFGRVKAGLFCILRSIFSWSFVKFTKNTYLIFAVIYTIEFQKRGLPHAHILVFLHAGSKYKTAADIDKVICAEIPDKSLDPELYEIVSTSMLHGPCGPQNPNSTCMQNDKCTKYFPKKFNDETSIDLDGYPVYRRRDSGVFVQKGESFLDNRFVVPYNRSLLLKYNAHINVEWCNQSRSIKYLFKYVNKGHDRVTTSFYGADQSSPDAPPDEIKMYYDCRYLSASEAAWRIFSFDIHYREPSVERLQFHLPGEHYVIYGDNRPIDSVLSRPNIGASKFLAWMDANKEYPEAKSLTYAEFPLKFVWHEDKRKWLPRKSGFSIGRLNYIPPGTGELYYLRMLLNHVRGAESFEDIRKINGKTELNFKDACEAMGLVADDKEYINAITEASHWGTGNYLRRLFATLLLSGQISRPEVVWNATWTNLSDDILHRQRLILQFPGSTIHLI